MRITVKDITLNKHELKRKDLEFNRKIVLYLFPRLIELTAF